MMSRFHLLITCICAAAIGIVFYGFYDEKIHIDFSWHQQTKQLPIQKETQTIELFFEKDDNISTISSSTALPLHASHLQYVINNWLSYAHLHHTTLIKIECHSLQIDHNIYYCSFTHSPFTEATPIHAKVSYIKGLLQTLYTLTPTLEGVVFLINHEEWNDSDLDFSLPWSENIYK